MKRLWDGARKRRPSIYEIPNEPLVDRISRDCRMDAGAFRDFFYRFRELHGIDHPLGDSGIQTCLALATRHRPSNRLIYHDIRLDKECPDRPFSSYFAGVLTVREICLRLGMEEGMAETIALESAEKNAKEGYVPFTYRTGVGGDLFDLLIVGFLLPIGKGLSIKWWKEKGKMGRIKREIRETFIRFGSLKGSLESERDGEIPDIKGFDDFAEERIAKLQSYGNALEYPYSNSTRLAAVVGDKGFIDAHGFAGLRPEKKLFEALKKRLGPEIFAVIAMYPWEADHLLKAAEMQRRGIPTATPVGRMFVGELEFAVFEWLPGENLLRVRDRGIWKRFGSLIRECHEKGIITDDAAGRNAIWTGEEIKLIDFEHTRIMEDATAIHHDDQHMTHQRICEELENSPQLLDAFYDGYHQK